MYSVCVCMYMYSQGIHQCGAPSPEVSQLEALVEVVVSPYLSAVVQDGNELLLGGFNTSI